MGLLAIILGIAAFILAIKMLERKVRFNALMAKYNDAELVDQLMDRKFWHGMSEEMLRDSLGLPVDIDLKVLESNTKEIWKYAKTKKTRFVTKITMEDGVVIGWD